MKKPVGLLPVLAEVQHVHCLGTSIWREVVYYDDTNNVWRPFSGSNTFRDGEIVTAWTYVNEIELVNSTSNS